MRKKLWILLLIFLSRNSFGQGNEVVPVDFSLKKFLNIRDFTLSNNGKEAYFSVQTLEGESAIIVRAVLKNKKWKNIEMVSFTGKFRDIEPFLSPDNLRLYFASNRPMESNSDSKKDYDIWYVEREDLNKKWSAPKNIGSPVNTKFNEFYPSVSLKNTLYYTSDSLATTRKDEIFRSTWNGRSYEKPISAGENINTEGYDFNAFIAPDESFLIYTIYKAKDGLGSGDLYVSFKDQKGEFLKAKNLGEEINSDRMEYCPFYDFREKILYFTSKRNEVKPKEVKTLEAFQKNSEQYSNGLSRIYKVQIDLEKL